MFIFILDNREVLGNLVLKPDLTLEWKRLIDIPVHDNITMTYTVAINSTENHEISLVNVTSMTSLSIAFLEEILTAQGSECMQFEFSVSSTTEAGTGPPARITENLPICERIGVNTAVIIILVN